MQNFKYPLSFKLPPRIIYFGMPVAPILMLVVVVIASFNPNAEADLVTTIFAVTVAFPFFCVISISNLSLFPEIELADNKFRLITPIHKSMWMDMEEIIDADFYLTLKQDRLFIVKIPYMSMGYRLNGLMYGRGADCFFVHKKIENYEDLVVKLSASLK